MKVLLIYTRDDGETAGRVRSLFEKMNIPIESLSVTSLESTDLKEELAVFFSLPGTDGNEAHRIAAPTHAAIVSALTRRWFDFFAGFSCGSHLPILVYGEEAVLSIPEEFGFCFTPLKTESALENYLEAEVEVFKKWEIAKNIGYARESLLQMGVPVTGESLAQCVGEGNVHEVSLFLATGFSPDTRNKAGVPLLNLAARKGNREVLKILIESGAHLNQQAEDRGSTALVDSVMSKHPELTADLIKAGADVNMQSKDGQTALVVAVGSGDNVMVEALLKAGADPDVCDSLGASARKYATLFHNKNILDLFAVYAPPKAV